jgi:glycosyltransferase 2 family protein
MKNRILAFFKYALPLVAAVLLLRYYVFEQVSVAEMLTAFRQAEYRWMVLSGVLAAAAHLARAQRWRLLMQPLGYSPNVFKVFLAVMVGYFANLLLPRMGEVTRCGILNRMERVPVNAAFGTVVAERIFDVIMLGLVFALTFLLEFNRLSRFFLDFITDKFSSFREISFTTYIIVTCVLLLSLALGIALYRMRARFDRFTFLVKIRQFVRGMLEGLLSIRKMRRKGEFILYTILIWVGYFFMSYVLFFALPQTQHLSLMAGLTVLLMGSLGNSAPVQGGTGAFHILVGNALLFYGLSQEDGIKLATFMWASQTLLILVLGGICFLISLFLQKNTRQEPITALQT